MASSQPCIKCRKRTLVFDDVTSGWVCSSCCVVQPFDDYQAQIGGISGPTGTSVRIGTSGTGSVYSYKETKIYEAQKLIETLTFKLGFSVSKKDEVKAMVETITEGEYGQGNWFSVLIGACGYVVMRKDDKVLPMVQIAPVVECDLYELGRMVNRVVSFLDLKLPEFDIVNSFERAIKSCPSFRHVREDMSDMADRMLKQGVFLVQCLVKWFLTTGRRPQQVVVAVLVCVAEINQVNIKIDDVARDLNVAVSTCRRRYKELLEKLVDVARVLPWGKDVTVKNILKNAPIVIQYMEVKSMAKVGTRKGLEHVELDLNGMMDDCLTSRIDCGIDGSATQNDSEYFDLKHSRSWNFDDLEKLKISPECLSEIFLKFRDEISKAKMDTESQRGSVSKRRRGYDLFFECTDWWQGNSEMSEKLFLEKILEKDVGLNPMPPSFDRGCLAYQRRREKIEAAKIRIENILHRGADLGGKDGFCLSKCVNVKKKRSKMISETDWEDFVIETLLLHKVKEEEIEKGYYNTLLDLHVFNSGIV